MCGSGEGGGSSRLPDSATNNNDAHQIKCNATQLVTFCSTLYSHITLYPPTHHHYTPSPTCITPSSTSTHSSSLQSEHRNTPITPGGFRGDDACARQTVGHPGDVTLTLGFTRPSVRRCHPSGMRCKCRGRADIIVMIDRFE